MKELLINRITSFVQDSKMVEPQFAEKFMDVFESIKNNKDYKKMIRAAKKEYDFKLKDNDDKVEALKNESEYYKKLT